MASENDTEPSNTIGPARPSDDGQRNSEQPNSKSVDGSKKDAQEPPAAHHGCSGKEKKHWIDYAIFWAALVAAVATSAAAGFTGWQAWLAKDTAKRQLRGYLVIGSNYIPKLGEGIQPFATTTIENIGQTPVFDGAWISGVNVMDYPLRQTILNDECSNVMNDPSAPKWMIGKSSNMEKWREIPFKASEVQAIHDGKAAIYFHGRICYRDIFKEVRHTDFCMFWKWENGSLGAGLACKEGNGGS